MKNKKTKVAIIGVIALVLVTMGITYAYWLVTRTQTKENVITTGCLDIAISGEANDISLTNQFPMSDEDGMELVPYEFTVTNNCNTSVVYQVALEATGTESGAISTSALKVALDDTVMELDSRSEVATTISGAYESRGLKYDTLAASGTEGSSVTYTLRLWIDENAPISEMNKTFTSKISVTVGQGIEIPPICSAVTEETKTTGNVPLGNYENGDEYICEVKYGTSYHFFVIGTEETGEVNLIMDRNITSTGTPVTDTDLGLVAWVSQEDYATANTDETDTSSCNNSTCMDEGAITANNKIAEYVSSWTNIEDREYNMTVDVYNSPGTGDFILTNNVVDVAQPYTLNNTAKARMMTVLEARDNGCKVEYDETTDTGEVVKHYVNTCPLYLSNHLEHKRGYVTGDNVVNAAAGIRGYWLLNGSYPDTGWNMHDNGVLNTRYANDTSYNGLRPVITLDKSEFNV